MEKVKKKKRDSNGPHPRTTANLEGPTWKTNKELNGNTIDEDSLDDSKANLERKLSLEPPPDGGWGWIIVIGVGIAFSITAGFNKSVSLFYEQLLHRFGRSAALTAGCTSLAHTLRMVLSPFVSALCNKTSHRFVGILGGLLTSIGYILNAFMPSLPWIYVSYSVLQGLGVCMFMVSNVSMINMYFSANRGKANALRSCFAGLGGLYMTQLVSFFYDCYGFSGTMIILSAMSLHIIPASALFRPLRRTDKISKYVGDELLGKGFTNLPTRQTAVKEASEQSKGILLPRVTKGEIDISVADETTEKGNLIRERAKSIAKLFGLDALKNSKFCILVALMTSCSMATSLNSSLLAGLALEKGYTKSQVTLLLSLNFSVEIPVRLLSGVFFDLAFVRPRRVIVYISLTASAGITMLVQPFMPALIPSMALWITQYVLQGFFQAQGNTVISDIVPRSMITSTVGLKRFIQGFGILIGPSLAGLVRDITGSYKYGYVVAGSQLTLIGIVLLVVSQCTSDSEPVDP